jgi:hypothetical protein
MSAASFPQPCIVYCILCTLTPCHPSLHLFHSFLLRHRRTLGGQSIPRLAEQLAHHTNDGATRKTRRALDAHSPCGTLTAPFHYPILSYTVSGLTATTRSTVPAANTKLPCTRNTGVLLCVYGSQLDGHGLTCLVPQTVLCWWARDTIYDEHVVNGWSRP